MADEKQELKWYAVQEDNLCATFACALGPGTLFRVIEKEFVWEQVVVTEEGQELEPVPLERASVVWKRRGRAAAMSLFYLPVPMGLPGQKQAAAGIVIPGPGYRGPANVQ
jgi:hypothetical protein